MQITLPARLIKRSWMCVSVWVVRCSLGVYFRRRAAMASDDQESETEYSDDDDDVRSAARDEVSPEPEAEYEHGNSLDSWSE